MYPTPPEKKKKKKNLPLSHLKKKSRFWKYTQKVDSEGTFLLGESGTTLSN